MYADIDIVIVFNWAKQNWYIILTYKYTGQADKSNTFKYSKVLHSFLFVGTMEN